MDDIVSWCKTGLQELNSLAQDRRRWKLITRKAMDTMVPEEEKEFIKTYSTFLTGNHLFFKLTKATLGV